MIRGNHATTEAILFRLSKEHNSDYSKVAIWTQITGTIAALIPGLLLEDADENSGGRNKNPFPAPCPLPRGKRAETFEDPYPSLESCDCKLPVCSKSVCTIALFFPDLETDK